MWQYLAPTGLAVAMVLVLACGAGAEEWRTFQVEFETKHGETPKKPGGKQTVTVRVPADLEPGEPLRGFMAQMKGLDGFAHRNRLAVCRGLMGEFGGPNQSMRDAAAKATGHPELRHAGAIVQGLSYGGRVRAHYAYENPGYTIAVILDHSWAPTSPTINPVKHEYGNLPTAIGVPMFFNSSRNDKFQGFDRRDLHYQWCTNAYRQHRQACTSVIHIERGGHGSVGNRDLVEVWLEEVMALRVPRVIPTDGTAYKLVPIDPRRVGGLVVAEEGKDAEGLTIHTNVSVAPVKLVSRPGECNWWMPGPKSAAMYVDWVKRNGGKVTRDLSDRFPGAAAGAAGAGDGEPGGAADGGDGEADAFYPRFEAEGVAAGVKAAQEQATAGRVGGAVGSLRGIVERNAEAAEVEQAKAALKVIDEWAASHGASAEALAGEGRAFEAAELLRRLTACLRGDARARGYHEQRLALLRTDAYKVGAAFDRIEKNMAKSTAEAKRTVYARFADQHPDTYYGKLARERVEALDGSQ